MLFATELSIAHTPDLTRCNADVVNCVRYVGSHYRNVSRTQANVVGGVCHADRCTAYVGDRIDDMSQFIVLEGLWASHYSDRTLAVMDQRCASIGADKLASKQ